MVGRGGFVLPSKAMHFINESDAFSHRMRFVLPSQTMHFAIVSDAFAHRKRIVLPSQAISPHRAKLTGYIITLNKVKGFAQAPKAFSLAVQVLEKS